MVSRLVASCSLLSTGLPNSGSSAPHDSAAPESGLPAPSAPAVAPPTAGGWDPARLGPVRVGEGAEASPEMRSPAGAWRLKVRFEELRVEIYDPRGQSVKGVSSSVLTKRKKTYL